MNNNAVRITDLDALAMEASSLIRWQARRFHRLPAGLDVEDLESAGNEAALEATLTYDPASGINFGTHARTTIRSRMADLIRSARARAKCRVPLQAERADGTPRPLPADPRANDPAEVAAARELARGRVNASVARVEQRLPSPAAVAEKVVALRAAMFAAIDAEGVGDAMRKMMEMAKAGDLKATRLLIDLLAPRMSGVVVEERRVKVTEIDDATG